MKQFIEINYTEEVEVKIIESGIRNGNTTYMTVAKDWKGIGDPTKYVCSYHNIMLLFCSNEATFDMLFYCPKCGRMFDAELLECHHEFREAKEDQRFTKEKEKYYINIFEDMMKKGLKEYIFSQKFRKSNGKYN